MSESLASDTDSVHFMMERVTQRVALLLGAAGKIDEPIDGMTVPEDRPEGLDPDPEGASGSNATTVTGMGGLAAVEERREETPELSPVPSSSKQEFLASPCSLDSHRGSVGSISSLGSIYRHSVMADLSQVTEKVLQSELLHEQLIEQLQDRNQRLNEKEQEVNELRERLEIKEQALLAERQTSERLRRELEERCRVRSPSPPLESVRPPASGLTVAAPLVAIPHLQRLRSGTTSPPRGSGPNSAVLAAAAAVAAAVGTRSGGVGGSPTERSGSPGRANAGKPLQTEPIARVEPSLWSPSRQASHCSRITAERIVRTRSMPPAFPRAVLSPVVMPPPTAAFLAVSPSAPALCSSSGLSRSAPTSSSGSPATSPLRVISRSMSPVPFLLQNEVTPCVDLLVKLGEAPPNIAEDGSVVRQVHWRLVRASSPVRTPLQTMRVVPALAPGLPATALTPTLPNAPGRPSPPCRWSTPGAFGHARRPRAVEDKEASLHYGLPENECGVAIKRVSTADQKERKAERRVKAEPMADAKLVPARSATP